MEKIMDVNLWKEFGLNGLIMGSVIGLFTYVIHVTLCTTRDIMRRSDENQKTWHEVFRHVGLEMDRHTKNSQTFHEQVTEAHRYQRIDHQQSLENQTRIHNCLVEVEKALGRINGYKKQ